MALQQNIIVAFENIGKNDRDARSFTNGLIHSNDFKDDNERPEILSGINSAIKNNLNNNNTDSAKEILFALSAFNELSKRQYIAELAPLFANGIAIANQIENNFNGNRDDEAKLYRNSTEAISVVITQYRETPRNSNEHKAARLQLNAMREAYIINNQHLSAEHLAQGQAHIESAETDIDKESYLYLIDRKNTHLKDGNIKKAENIIHMLAKNCAKDSVEKETSTNSGLDEIYKTYTAKKQPDDALRVLGYQHQIITKAGKPFDDYFDRAIECAKLYQNQDNWSESTITLCNVIAEADILSEEHNSAWKELSATREHYIKTGCLKKAKEITDWQKEYAEEHKFNTKNQQIKARDLYIETVGKYLDIAEEYRMTLPSHAINLAIHQYKSSPVNSVSKTKAIEFISFALDEAIENKDNETAELCFYLEDDRKSHKIGSYGVALAKLYEEQENYKKAFDIVAHGYSQCNHGSPEQIQCANYMMDMIDELIAENKYEEAENAIITAKCEQYYNAINNKYNSFSELYMEDKYYVYTGLSPDELNQKEDELVALHIEQGNDKAFLYAHNILCNYNNSDHHLGQRRIANKIQHAALDNAIANKSYASVKEFLNLRLKSYDSIMHDENTILSRYHELPKLLLEEKQYTEALEEAKDCYTKIYQCKEKNVPWDFITAIREHYNDSYIANCIANWQKICARTDEHKSEIAQYFQRQEKLETMKNSANAVIEKFLPQNNNGDNFPKNALS